MHTIPEAGSVMPEIMVNTVGGDAVNLGGTSDRWKLVIVYRGLHCPICKRYLGELHKMKAEFDELGTDIIVLSGDAEDRAVSFRDEVGLTDFPVGYDLGEDDMRTLGLFVTQPLSHETDRKFPEPGLFLVRPDGNIHIVDIANAPFIRPELPGVLRAIKVIQERDYPVRGAA